MTSDEPREILVIANETVAGQSLLDALRKRAHDGPIRVTVLAPVNHPREGYVVYQDTRRAAAGRRLDRTLELLHGDGISAMGLVVDADPVSAVKDAIAQLSRRRSSSRRTRSRSPAGCGEASSTASGARPARSPSSTSSST